ncbi:S-layer homology domain-containing protein [Anaerovorax odorimutans]|uniref:S-layer homology domain-containing protein n=1 Tax=Anaerovorax odorimutans TaxID=109327 RepID=UPI000400B06E|nr:S-layer homology domain-containing protein [Anaerovorax odorimutans]
MNKNVYKKSLALLIVVSMLVTLLPVTASALSFPTPTGLKLGIGEIGNEHYSGGYTELGLHFDRVEEIEDEMYAYSFQVDINGRINNDSWIDKIQGGSVNPFVGLCGWITRNGESVAERYIDSVTISFTDDNNENNGPSATLNTNITVEQVESDAAYTAYYVGTKNPYPPDDQYYHPDDKEATFKVRGVPVEHTFEFVYGQVYGQGGSIIESNSNGIVDIRDQYPHYNAKWNYGLGDMVVDANDEYYLDVYDTHIIDDTTATLTITRHPVNFVFDSFQATVEGNLTYNGSQITPNIIVKTTDETPVTLTEGTDYTVSFEKNGSAISANEVKNAGNYTVVISGKEGSEYEGKVATKSFTIAKATPNNPEPITGITAEYGKTLADIVLPSGFSWQDAKTTLVGNVGNNTFKVQYTPDEENYNAITGIDVTITVTKANQEVPVLNLSSETGILGLTPPALKLTGGSGTGALHYVSSNPDVAAVDEATGAISVKGVGTATFTVTKDGDSNYNASSQSAGVTLTVKDKIDLTVKDTAATETALVAHLKNQGQINVGTPLRIGLTNNFTVDVKGKKALTTYASSDTQQGEAKWIGLIIGNLKVNNGSSYLMTDLYYKTAEAGSYAKLTEKDKNESLQVGGTDKELVLWIKSDVDTTKNIWLATSASGENETKLTVNFTPYSDSPSGGDNDENSGSHSSGHSGGHSGGSSTTTTNKTTNSTEVKTTSQETTTISTSVNATTDAKGKASITMPAKTITGLIEKAKEAEKQDKKAVIEISVKTDAAAKAAEVTIEKAVFGTIIKETKAGMKIETGIGSIIFDQKAMKTIGDKGNEDVSIRMENVDKINLSDEVKNLVGENPVYDLTVLSGDTKISSFDGGLASISIPYTLKSGDDKNAVVVYYIDDNGNLQTVRGKYNDKTKNVDFVVGHFSQYAVGYNKIMFSDVSNSAWYSDAVTFLSARGIANGTSQTTFSPNVAITRGEFLVMLMRAYGIEPKENSVSNFADAGNTYYTAYLAAAKELNITQGVGSDLYKPNAKISRQDMFTMLYRALEVLGEVPDKNSMASSAQFTDSQEIADYAKSSVEALADAGIISGSNGKLDPIGESTRAQMSQIIFNLLSE